MLEVFSTAPRNCDLLINLRGVHDVDTRLAGLLFVFLAEGSVAPPGGVVLVAPPVVLALVVIGL